MTFEEGDRAHHYRVPEKAGTSTGFHEERLPSGFRMTIADIDWDEPHEADGGLAQFQMRPVPQTVDHRA